MFNRHEHQWVETKRNFNLPSEYTKMKQENASDALIMRLVYGVTNIEQQCEVCGKIEIVSMSGKI